ncbi:MAG: hypothetical protein AB8C84_10425 [Oligoflexales bacterium]
MGLRILRDDSPQYQEKIDQLASDKLQEEAERWCSRTHRTPEENHSAQQHLTEGRERSHNSDEPMAEVLESATDHIQKNKPSLDQIQGHMDIEKMLALLD